MKHTVKTIQAMKDKNEKITMLTAYDYPTAKKINEAGIDMALVGDSCAMVIHGHPTTLTATMEMMLLHCSSVARACDDAMVIGDMPFGSFHYSIEETMRNAARFIVEAKADAVKFEGAPHHIEKTSAIVEMGIPVVGHIGLKPQAVGVLGGFKVQGKNIDSARKVVAEALALQEAGAFAVIIEAVPTQLATYITNKLDIPTIGVGGGPGCSGQVLVSPDVLGMYDRFLPSFAKQYQQFSTIMLDTFTRYKQEVQSGIFPAAEHSYQMSEEVMEMIEKEFDRA